MTPAMREVGMHLVKSIQENFESGRSPEGAPWKPSKRALREHGKTLVDTRRLEGSVSFQASPDKVEVGTNVEYAAIHQFGGEIHLPEYIRTLRFKVNKDGKSRFAKRHSANFEQDVRIGKRTITMPARPFLGVAEADWEEIGNIFLRHILGGL